MFAGGECCFFFVGYCPKSSGIDWLFFCFINSPDAEDGNEMVFCDSCNICVHQACYGITVIPDGEWLCRPCKELGYQKDLSCVLCPSTGGALKPTTVNGEWAHVSCALWVPEVNNYSYIIIFCHFGHKFLLHILR